MSDVEKPDLDNLGKPRQFGLIDLFGLITVAAIFAAMVAPFVREMQLDHRLRLLAVSAGQLLIVGIVVAIAVKKRARGLTAAGQRLGVAFCGQVRWRHWPVVRSSLQMLILASIQFAVAAAFTYSGFGAELPATFLIYHAQLAVFCGIAAARFMWRVYPGCIEFFENGIVLSGVAFMPWTQVEVRDSQFFSDRVAVVIRPENGTHQNTLMAQVPDALRKRIKTAAEKTS